MNRTRIVLGCVLFVLLGSNGYGQEIIIDHTCTNLNAIPMQYINAAIHDRKWHYAHTSHGEQLTIGLERIETQNGQYNVEIMDSQLPDASDALCVFNGQENDTYITPDMYWESEYGCELTRDVLRHNPPINISQWAWCGQCEYYSQDQIYDYLHQISAFEAEFPSVRFVYMTGHAQNEGEDGYNRWINNEIIRQYCRDNNKILFDFADLDAWWFNPSTGQWEFSSYQWNGETIPVEHPHFHGDEAAHTTYESCEQKGRAVWWLMAKLSGWGSSNPTPTPTPNDTPTPGDCQTTGVTLWMPGTFFRPGDDCACVATVCNAESYSLNGYPLFVILDIWGEYYFAPDFSGFNSFLDMYPSFPPGITTVSVLPDFRWPSGCGSAENILFYGALTDPDITRIVGNMDIWEFGWGE